MENILEIRNLDDYDYSNIKLSSPSMQTGNNYYTNITIGDIDKHLYIQFPKCTTKAGYVKNNSKSYTDLIFSASDTRIIKWLENFETYLQNEIYKKRDLWFDTEIALDDIQELMTPIMRSYRSGKNVLIRCNIKNHKCSVYDENEILLDLEKFTTDKEIIPLVSVNGIKFSSKNFAIELNLSQIMIITSKDDLEKNCLIKSSVVKKNKEKGKEREKDKSFSNNLEILDIKEKDNQEVEKTRLDNDNGDDNGDDNDGEVEILDSGSDDVNTLETKTETVDVGEIRDNPDEKNILLDISDKIGENVDVKLEEEIDSSNRNQELGKDVLDEIDLDTLDIEDIGKSDNIDKSHSLEQSDKINIRDPQEIYYEIYKNALIKANTLKRNTIEAFLNAKNIKLKYNLEDLDLDVDDDLDTDLDTDLDESLENEL